MADIKQLVFFDLEVDVKTKKVCDYGAIKGERVLRTQNMAEFGEFLGNYTFLCGHNIIAHDLKYIQNLLKTEIYAIDTLTLSPLLFPQNPYHALVKDDKLQVEELNNPLNDSLKARDLFFDELNAFYKLTEVEQRIYRTLLKDTEQFKGFFEFVEGISSIDVEQDIRQVFKNKICDKADIKLMAKESPIELAYALALIAVDDKYSITPPWVCINYPKVEWVITKLRNNSCKECEYCKNNLNIKLKLKQIFGYGNFRSYAGEPLQERATQSAVDGKSLLAIFPTGGGKSLAFQLPALIAGENSKALTVVISPLQSLMKDQVDNLSSKGIVDAVTINGLLTPLERAEAIKRVSSGLATILYISPESLRSKTIEKLLLSRSVSRFVIDEAHCFSAWGQDFRVDYMYIGDFIKKLKEKKRLDYDIPVSCFTATAKQKVISDICEYFKDKLGLSLELFTTQATRKNLQYSVLYQETEDDKYQTLRRLIEEKDCVTIVYVSRTKRTRELADKLTKDGYPALAFNGKMDNNEKIKNQDAFMKNEAKIMVATSAFGMGVDKQDVKLVVHYDISASLEDYVQEAGRAGRNEDLQAECYVLFNNGDLDKHFMLLNQTKLSIGEIQQVWKAIKDLTRHNESICKSALEIARQAGWDDSVNEIETRVKTALSALENAGYIERGKNIPRVYASSILVDNMAQAVAIIEKSTKITGDLKIKSKRIIKLLISTRSIASAQNDEAASRIDYIADNLGIDKKEVITCVNLMREEQILADSMDLSIRVKKIDSKQKADVKLTEFIQLERFLLQQINDGVKEFNYKELNDKAQKEGLLFCNPQKLKTVLYFWTISGFIQKQVNIVENRDIGVLVPVDKIKIDIERRLDLSQFIIKYLFREIGATYSSEEDKKISFSVLELQKAYSQNISLFSTGNVTADELQNALLYLSKINALSLEGGFLVIYNSMEIRRLNLDNKIKYKQEDYRLLEEYYKQKIQQIHIVGEYAKMMVESYADALQFVNDYFQMNYKQFLNKYFKGNRLGEINRNITPEKYDEIFGRLSKAQAEIVGDDTSKCLVVAAGPGSGKTRVLVHKLASLMLMEDVKHEQLLMLTFSRSAATEFKSRLIKMIGNAANFIEIKTFHSYCFDLLGQIGNIEESKDIVKKAADMIESGEVELGRITKSVLVIDEAQDMDEKEFLLLKALMNRNEDMRVIAVGDDDQNIYEFRGSSSKYFNSLETNYQAKRYELIDNYRSAKKIVDIANVFVKTINNRMKLSYINSVTPEDGVVNLVKHIGGNFEASVVQDVVDNLKAGTTCVLTGTNNDAIKVVGLLTKRGVNAKLIQSNDGFNLSKLAEIKYFLYLIEKRIKGPVIDNDLWCWAINNLKVRYENSTCLQNCLNLLNVFYKNNKTKYKTDLEEFIYESKYDDYINCDNKTILVSTIHKSKGKEFDNVYMLLNNYILGSDEAKRPVYVGMTRAKHSLTIHYNGSDFDRYKTLASSFVVDENEYEEPKEIVVQLSHRDIYLDFFKNKKGIIKNLVAGQPLEVEGDFLLAKVGGVQNKILKFSGEWIKELNKLKAMGYSPHSAQIRFIVGWKGQDDIYESLIILPDLKLIKN